MRPLRILLVAFPLCFVLPAHAQPTAWPEGTYRIPTDAGGEAAPWLEPPTERTHADAYLSSDLEAEGRTTALVETRYGAFVVSSVDFSITPVVLPNATWYGIAGEEALLAFDHEGRLLRAASPAAASTLAGWSEVRTFGDGWRWDAAGPCVVGFDGSDEVALSDDGGLTFTLAKPNRGHGVQEARCRVDGVVVTLHESPGGAMTRSADGVWESSPFVPAGLERHGAMIHADWGDPPPVLSSDGRTWSDEVDVYSGIYDHHGLWSLLTFETETRGAPGTRVWRSAEVPAAPAPDPTPPEGIQETAGLAGLSGFGTGGMGMSGGRACRGIECLHGTWGPPPPLTRTLTRLFSNARCARADSADPAACAPDSEWLAPPTVALVDLDTETLAQADLPPDCANARVEDIAGLVLALCAQAGEVRIHARTRASEWQPEASIVADLASIEAPSMAPDGTTVLHRDCPCDEACRAYLRPPGDIGTPWVTLGATGVRAWRPVEGGYALGARGGPSGAPEDIELVLADRTGGVTPLTSLRGPADLRGLRVDDGRVSLLFEDGGWRVALADGTFVAAALPEQNPIVDGVPVMRAQPARHCGPTPPAVGGAGGSQ